MITIVCLFSCQEIKDSFEYNKNFDKLPKEGKITVGYIYDLHYNAKNGETTWYYFTVKGKRIESNYYSNLTESVEENHDSVYVIYLDNLKADFVLTDSINFLISPSDEYWRNKINKGDYSLYVEDGGVRIK